MNEFLGPLIKAVNQALFEFKFEEPSDLVEYCAPIMSKLIQDRPTDALIFAQQLDWPQEDATDYVRQRLYEGEDGAWSIYAITWLPGQYTPIHDHGTWGVVGVLKGRLREHQMARVDGGEGDENIKLVRAGVCLLTTGAVNTFIPEPDHIHYTGIPEGEQPTASLHLYGRLMTQYNAYDLEKGYRYPLDVE